MQRELIVRSDPGFHPWTNTRSIVMNGYIPDVWPSEWRDLGPEGIRREYTPRCHWGPGRDESTPPDTAEVYLLSVPVSIQRMGIGPTLLKTAMGEMKEEGIKKVYLWVHSLNQNARKTYERLGWQWDGDTKTINEEFTMLRYNIDL